MESDDSASENEACVGGIQWTRQEDNLLREAAAKFSGKAWKRIAEHCFPDGSRDKDQCLQRWRMISKPRSIKGPWTPEEDRQLRSLVNELGAEKWVLIASRLGSRTGKQCRERWHNHLDPSIDKSPFTAKEDELIFKLFEQFGSKWAEMSKLMPGRPDNAIKNHFNTSMQRKRRRLSLQDPSELQMKLPDNNTLGSATTNISPLASPTSATSPTTLSRNHRFDPYGKYIEYQPSLLDIRRHSMPSLELAAMAHAGFQAAHSYSASESQRDNAQTPRSVPTPPITPDAKCKTQFSPNMSRSISMGSSIRLASGIFSPHNKVLQGPSPGPVRPNLPGNPSIHKSNSTFYASISGVVTNPASSPSLQGKMTRSSSSMSVSSTNGGPVHPYSNYPLEHGCNYYQQEQQSNHSLPRPNMTRHESLEHNSIQQSQHVHHQSLDMDPFSALAELANLAEQHREMPIQEISTATTTHNKEESTGHNHDSDYGQRKTSMTVISDRNSDIEDTVMSTKIAKSTLTRRFSTSLSHLTEEDHPEEYYYRPDSRRTHHSYHVDQRPNDIQARRNSTSPSTRPSPTVYFQSERSSDDYSGSDNGGSDRDHDDMEMDHCIQRQISPKPSASYLNIRRGSVRELMAIDNLCLSSEEIERR
ncbi:DNA binding transcription coactivator transcription factor [Linnemannia zychae]|nr:DNA binding transcription coactivator transcription factor [Linnemannia zychae]